MSNTLKLSRFVWGTLRFDSICTLCLDSIRTESRLANRLPVWRIDNRGNNSCRFDQIDSNRQHFQPTLHSSPEVKIHKITIHELSLFLKRGHKPQSIRTIRVDSIESTRIDNIFNPPSKSRSTAWNRVHESISGLSNRKYQRRSGSIWVYWTTLERPSHSISDFAWFIFRPEHFSNNESNSDKLETDWTSAGMAVVSSAYCVTLT